MTDDDGQQALFYAEQEQATLEALDRCYWQQARLEDLHALAAMLGVGQQFMERHPQ